ncbi:MAG TPA: hypothetical protein VFZ79_18375 [Acidimicrobiales bacterium]
MSDKTRHVRWVAPVALVGALGFAACGDGDGASDATARTAGVGAVAVGSDRHLENLAAEAATNPANVTGSDRHLENLAAEGATNPANVTGSDRHLENLAADIGGRSGDQGPNVFEAGNRAAEAALQADG